MARNHNLYQQVVEITTDYLGPASQRFIDRQIINHLNKPPKDITKRDLAGMIDWISAVVALLTEDQRLVDEYTERLSLLASKPPAKVSEV